MLGFPEITETPALEVVRSALEVDLILGARLAGAVKREFQRESIGLIEDLEGVHYQLKIELMGETRLEEAIAFLSAALQHHEDINVRGIAASALGKLGSVKAIPVLLQALQDGNFIVRGSAADALGKLGDANTMLALIQVFQNESLPFRESAVKALGNLGNVDAIPTLLHALKDEDFNIRWNASYALGQLGNVEVIPNLLNALNDEHCIVRMSAADALGKLGSAEAIPALLHASKDVSSYVRSSVVKALKAISPLSPPALQDASSFVKGEIAYALGRLDNANTIPALLQASKDEDFHVRWSAINALGSLCSVETIPALLQLLQESPDLYWLAAGYLEIFGAPDTLKALWQSYRTTTDGMTKWAIASIQERCQYYNYELEEERKSIATQTDAEERSVEQPIPNKYYITAEVAQIIEGNKGNIIGKRDHKAE